ncbi:MAG: hypothetical protein HYT63_01130 [Candidatus Yanofskybacteria bacterium]|nr:hypothetical protein [Candidatus Yanofskybacteria bacterium]
MRKDKEKAELLRRTGKSYKQINRELSIPTATLSDWFRDKSWSIEIRDRLATAASFSSPEKLRLMVAATKKKFALLHEEYRREAIEEFEEKKKDHLFIAGLMLYWGEGDKNVKNSDVKLSNSDSGMIRVFYVFLTNSMLVPAEKITLSLLLYPDLVDSVQKKSWSMTTGIPLAQFRKSVFIKGRHPTRRLSHGVGMIRVGGRKYKEKLLKWIELAMRDFGNKTVV